MQFTPDQRTTNAVADSSQFGLLLRHFRASAGLTQAELAERAGLSWRGIADLERGVRRAPYPSTVRRLAEALSLTPVDRAKLAAASGRAPADLTLPALRPSGVHPQASSLVGRERELSEIKELLAEHRLLTLTGPPGVGKTRLAYEAGFLQSAEYCDGAAAVELAPLTDPELVVQTVANCIGVSRRPNQSMLDTLTDVLRDKQLLLVLDNCEHLPQACATLADRIVRECPGVRIIATTRAPLHVPDEKVLNVPPLGLPDPRQTRTAVQLARSEAARLFLHRCRMVQPRFVLTDADAATVAKLCVRLDGLPLALELAAARMRTLPLKEITRRLNDRFRLLIDGNRTAQPHQQTLIATLDWSYHLLSRAERRVFEAMSVFVGGADADAVTSVCAPAAEHDDATDVISRLVDQSLVTVESDADGQVRYRLLESIREYAQVHLSTSAEAGAVQSRHAEVYYNLVVCGAPPRGEPDASWMERLDEEPANVRAALQRYLDVGDLEHALRLASAMAPFWDRRGYLAEGRQRLAEILDAAVDREDRLHLEAIIAAAHLARREDDYAAVDRLVALGLSLERRVGDAESAARLLATRAVARGFQGDFASARALHEQVVSVWRGLDDLGGLAAALNNLAIGCDQLGDFEATRAALVECITLARRMTPGRTLASALNNLGLLWQRWGNAAEARPLIEESLAIARGLGDVYATANALGSLGLVAHQSEDRVGAKERFEQALAIRRQTGDRRGVAVSLQNLAGVLLDLGELAQAELLLDESVDIFNQLGSTWGVADALETMACVAAAQADMDRANHLIRQAQESRRITGARRPAHLQAQLDQWFVSTPDSTAT